MTSVYLLNAFETTLYKIGISRKNLQERLISLQTGCPYKLEIVWEYKTEHATIVEKIAHRHFSYAKSNSKKEWFDFENISIEEVKRKIIKIDNTVKLIKENEKKNSH